MFKAFKFAFLTLFVLSLAACVADYGYEYDENDPDLAELELESSYGDTALHDEELMSLETSLGYEDEMQADNPGTEDFSATCDTGSGRSICFNDAECQQYYSCSNTYCEIYPPPFGSDWGYCRVF